MALKSLKSLKFEWAKALAVEKLENRKILKILKSAENLNGPVN